jgi:hypothetical protein
MRHRELITSALDALALLLLAAGMGVWAGELLGPAMGLVAAGLFLVLASALVARVNRPGGRT